MESIQQLLDPVIQYLPSLLGAIAILVVGWLAAWIISLAVRGALRRTTIDNRVASFISGDGKPGKLPVEEVARKIVFYLLMLFVLVAFFQAIGLTIMTEPLNELLNQVFAFAPRILGVIALFAVAWVLASAVRLVITRTLGRLNLEEKMTSHADLEGGPDISIARTLGEAAYWLVFLLFLPAILGTLALEGLLQPVQAMVNELMQNLPNLLTAVVILALGWFVARVVQRIVTNLLAAMGVDRIGSDAGVTKALGNRSLSSLLGLVVHVLILVPVITASLNALAIDAVTEPASNMLNTLLSAVPSLFAASIVLGVAYLVGRIASTMVTSILAGAGFDKVLTKLGIPGQAAEGGNSPSKVAGTVVFIVAMLLALIEATSILGFENLAGLFTDLTAFGGNIAVALAVMALALWLGNVAATAVRSTGARQAHTLALVSRVAILVLGGAMALRELGVANEIITLAFGLTLGAVAVAAAVAFGLGGREIAARQLETWSSNFSGNKG